ncbi:HAD family hydrolase [Pelolinea submarina]|uniref:Putative hydrolase of the HAD superfamily/soluble epoxide hydrolase/lipid-phosphate phosphatase n=1 Tax=Pelolinea submarina TaxID=913107 RepID=A0A347ZSK9_9CHLR|nr:HAD family phosphatase [Pelolinea submarina]REG11142.1 putative hydrolase of the HAD superfamily/soluble epoxide hydrolase/lipid-phosphate phosphatase [Pelolinea submarina]BBB48290.1 HAD-superfamily hydrolase [Pelolinea submarina]
MQKAIKAVIFDMGGVILRTVDPAPREGLAKRLGVPRMELEMAIFTGPTSLQSEIGELSDIEHWETIAALYHQPIESWPQLYNEFFGGDEVDMELVTYLRGLKGKFKIGLLSNAWVNGRQNLVKLYGDFLDVFDVSVFSSEIGLRKPDERAFQAVLDKLGVEAQEAIFVDDVPHNTAGAAEMGIHAVLFTDRDNAIKEINNRLKT